MRYLVLSLFLIPALINCSSNPTYTVKEFSSPTGENASLPRLFTDNTGTVFMSWVESDGDSTSLLYSSLTNNEWTKSELISKSDSWFVNWADFPSITARNGEPIAVHWPQKIPGGTYAYNVNITNASSDWEHVIAPHNDNTPTEHGFVSMAPASDSTFVTIWLDGRNTVNSGGHDDHDTPSGIASAMTLRAAVIDADLNVLESYLIDESVCDCCGTTVVNTESGFITAYRNRTENEIRDIYISRFVNGQWENSKPVFDDNWNIAACPVNGPSIDADGNSIAVAWFSGANDESKVKVAFSEDEGQTFSQPIVLDNGNPLGRVDVEFLEDGTALVSWMERNMEDRSKAFFNGKKVSKKGQVLNEFKISLMESSRRSGFPQISSYNKSIIAAWTDLSTPSTPKVKVAILE